MNNKKTTPAKKKTPLQRHLSKNLKPYKPGYADCVNWAAEYVNEVLGAGSIKIDVRTFGEVVRALRRKDLKARFGEAMERLGVKEAKTPKDGNLAIYECENALGGQVVGIFHEGVVIARMEGEKLFKKEEPKIIIAWEL